MIAIRIVSILVSILHRDEETTYINAEKINYNNNIKIWHTLDIHQRSLFILKELCGEAENRVALLE